MGHFQRTPGHHGLVQYCLFLLSGRRDINNSVSRRSVRKCVCSMGASLFGTFAVEFRTPWFRARLSLVNVVSESVNFSGAFPVEFMTRWLSAILWPLKVSRTEYASNQLQPSCILLLGSAALQHLDQICQVGFVEKFPSSQVLHCEGSLLRWSCACGNHRGVMGLEHSMGLKC